MDKRTFTGVLTKIFLVCGVIVHLLPASAADAQITLDGTMGQSGALSGPDYVITAGMGSQSGANLFHSFGAFNVNTGESATFAGPESVANVIGRVTGGSASNIDGRLSCSIQDANLYLINPAGMMFGPNATLDVTGSFVATTADYVKLNDGGRFDAVNPSASVLTSAPVSAFGFLDGNIGAITVDGSYLQVADGKSLSLIGGDISVRNGYLVAPGGRIDMVSVGSAGEVLFSGDSAPDVSSFDEFGNIDMTHDDPDRLINSSGVELANMDTSGDGGGVIYIRGGRFVMDGGYIFADTYGAKNGAGIDIDVAGDLEMLNESGITSASLSEGDGGDITISAAGGVTISGGSFIVAESQGEMAGAGAGGNIFISAASVDLKNLAIVSAGTIGAGAGGDVNITADSVTLSGESEVTVKTDGVIAGSGDGGDIRVNAVSVALDESYLTADTMGLGAGGSVNINATSMTLSTESWIRAASEGEMAGAGAGGDILINAGGVDLSGASTISATTWGSGAGGDVNITAGSILLSGGSWIYADSKGSMAGSGGGGEIIISAQSVDLENASVISANTFGSGAGGDVRITADGGVALSGGSSVSAMSLGDMPGSGDGGAIIINADNVDLKDWSNVSASAYGSGAGGDVRITANGAVTLSGGSFIHCNSLGEMDGAGAGGKIFISAAGLDLKDWSDLSASSSGPGAGGDVNITAASVALSGGGWIFSTSAGTMNGAGAGGAIHINAGNIDMKNQGQISVGTAGSGAGGDMDITASRVALSGGSFISGLSAGTMADAGRAGNINLYVADSLSLSASGVTTESARSSGGSITINGGAVILTGGGAINASVASGEGGGGNVTINSMNLLALDKSDITANAYDGRGGKVFLNTDAYIHSGDSVITANSNRQELRGTVTIQSPALDISGSLAALSASYNTSGVMATDRCAARSFEEASSFTLGGRDGIPLDPESAILLRAGNKDDCGGMEDIPAGRKH